MPTTRFLPQLFDGLLGDRLNVWKIHAAPLGKSRRNFYQIDAALDHDMTHALLSTRHHWAIRVELLLDLGKNGLSQSVHFGVGKLLLTHRSNSAVGASWHSLVDGYAAP